jgi:hypothetical protein
MKHLLTSVVLASAMFSVGAFAGPSAKFAATYGNDGPYLVSIVLIEDADVDTGPVFDNKTGFTLATIKVPQDKELLVGVSAEIGLTTDTSIKGKNGGAARSIAGASAGTLVFACPVDGGACTDVALPGPITLSQRIQVLSATLGGVLESCTDLDDSGTIDVKTECEVSDEEIGLMLDTLAAHHFNFVLPNMDQGEYNIIVVFGTGAMAQIDIDETSVEEGGTVSGSAFATAWIGSYMVTVQQVRATKGGIIDVDIIEQ